MCLQFHDTQPVPFAVDLLTAQPLSLARSPPTLTRQTIRAG